MKKRGSAIVITMLLISAISMISFGLAKALVLNTSTVTLYEDGSVAYYAAESGLEEGFLRYRYNQNATVPITNWLLGDSKVFKTTIGKFAGSITPSTDSGSNSAGISPVSSSTSVTKNEQSYELRMGHLGTDGKPFYGSADSSGNLKKAVSESFVSDASSGSVYVNKDESIKIDLTGLNFRSNTNNLNLNVQFYGMNGTDSAEACKALLEVKFTVIQNGTTKEYTDILKPNTATGCELNTNLSGINTYRTISGSNGASISPSAPPSSLYYEVTPLEQVFDRAFANMPDPNTDKVSLMIRPLYFNARIGLIMSSCEINPSSCTSQSNTISGPYTTISSTGYFGSVVKKLSANIDRQSGTLYDLFDYVIYKKS